MGLILLNLLLSRQLHLPNPFRRRPNPPLRFPQRLRHHLKLPHLPSLRLMWLAIWKMRVWSKPSQQKILVQLAQPEEKATQAAQAQPATQARLVTPEAMAQLVQQEVLVKRVEPATQVALAALVDRVT